MTVENKIKILAQGNLTGVAVHWDPCPCILEPAVQAYIDERWAVYMQDAQAHGRTLFNGPITRLMDHRVERTTLHLSLGPSDFKTFLVTALRDHAWFAGRAPAAICAALGNSGLIAYGQQCVLGIRSSNVAAYAGKAHVFGGVLEQLDTSDYPASPEGLLAHLRCELQEELDLTAPDLAGQPRLLAMVYDQTLHQPELLWHWELQNPIATILHRLNQDEHTGHLILHCNDALKASEKSLTPGALFAFQAWSKLQNYDNTSRI